jgi:hypothetical protein
MIREGRLRRLSTSLSVEDEGSVSDEDKVNVFFNGVVKTRKLREVFSSDSAERLFKVEGRGVYIGSGEKDGRVGDFLVYVSSDSLAPRWCESGRSSDAPEDGDEASVKELLAVASAQDIQERVKERLDSWHQRLYPYGVGEA